MLANEKNNNLKLNKVSLTMWGLVVQSFGFGQDVLNDFGYGISIRKWFYYNMKQVNHLHHKNPWFEKKKNLLIIHFNKPH
jgi:hypothetical protein